MTEASPSSSSSEGCEGFSLSVRGRLLSQKAPLGRVKP